jgi:hypothetical protein
VITGDVTQVVCRAACKAPVGAVELLGEIDGQRASLHLRDVVPASCNASWTRATIATPGAR